MRYGSSQRLLLRHQLLVKESVTGSHLSTGLPTQLLHLLSRLKALSPE